MEVCECLMKFSFLCFRFSFRGRDVTVANTGIAENLPELMVKLNVCVHLTNLAAGFITCPDNGLHGFVVLPLTKQFIWASLAGASFRYLDRIGLE